MTTRRNRPLRLQDLQQRNEELQIRLAEAEETLRAIREGEVDAVIVSGTRGEQVFSLTGSGSIYRLIVETMKEAAFTVTLDGTILFCNAQFGRFVQLPPEQIVGSPLRKFVTADNLAAASSLLLAAREQSVRQRLVFQAGDGAAVPAHVSAHVSATFLDQPDSPSICVVASDLTELESSTELIQQLRRQQEALQAANEELAATEEELRVQNEELNVSRAELERARARYQDLFETAPDGYLVTDPEGAVQEVNQAAGRLLGRPAATLKGNPLSSLLPGADREGYLRLLGALNAGASPLPRWELEVHTPAGTTFWAAVTAAASLGEDGRIQGLRWLIRDVTDRKHAEECLLKSSKNLERSNQELEAFAYIASHDLQEPLRAVSGFLDLLQVKYRDGLDDAARNYIGRAREGAARMSALIQDLLEYARVSAEARQPAEVDLAAVANGVREDLRAAIEEVGAALVVDSLPTVRSDSGQMRQLLQNLIGNALKFRAEGRPPEIRLAARREAGEWLISVADNGIGIPSEHRQLVFAIFRRLHGRQKYPGTGIGLAICQKIVERHGGRIWVESEPGQGSTFTFTLPASIG